MQSAEDEEENKKITQSKESPFKKETNLSMKCFQIVGMLAEGKSGSYAEVYEATYLSKGKKVCIKKIYKEQIINSCKQNEVYIERYILLNYTHCHPGMIQFYGSFQDQDFLYFVTEYCPFGDLSVVMNECYQAYVNQAQNRAQIDQLIRIVLLNLHVEGIAHLDVKKKVFKKPKNFVVDSNYNIKLIDFATSFFYDKSKQPAKLATQIEKYAQLKLKRSKIRSVVNLNNQDDDNGFRNSFVGTPQYVSPEMLELSQASKEADLWAVGCIIYEVYRLIITSFQFYYGKQPFTDTSENAIFNNILSLKYGFNNSDKISAPPEAIDLIKRLLVMNPNERIGSQCAQDIFNHRYFESLISQNYLPWQGALKLPECCEKFFSQIYAKQSMMSIIWAIKKQERQSYKELTEEDNSVKFQLKKNDAQRLNTIIEVQEEASPFQSSNQSLKFGTIVELNKKDDSKHQDPIKEEIYEETPFQGGKSSVETAKSSLLKKIIQSGLILLMNQSFCCLPQVALLIASINPSLLTIDLLDGKKIKLKVDQESVCIKDGHKFVFENKKANQYYRFRNAEQTDIHWDVILKRLQFENFTIT